LPEPPGPRFGFPQHRPEEQAQTANLNGRPLHLGGANLRQDWITRPDWDKACTQPDQTGTGDGLPGGAIAYGSDEDGPANGCRSYVYRLTHLDASSAGCLRRAQRGNAYVRKADGTNRAGGPQGPGTSTRIPARTFSPSKPHAPTTQWGAWRSPAETPPGTASPGLQRLAIRARRGRQGLTLLCPSTGFSRAFLARPR